ncbi:hypothetical protein RHI9324_00166 [Rhizobium sp. CECT 9324]|nr:hypothetical protein RHI9324_00166 [Rhizobium sp. CECT 9324]
MRRWNDYVIRTDEIEDRHAQLLQIRQKSRPGHEIYACRDIFGTATQQVFTDLFHCRSRSFVLPGARLVINAFNRSPAKLLAGRDPAMKELAKQIGSDMWDAQQPCSQSFLSLEPSASEGSDHDHRAHKFGMGEGEQQGDEPAGGVTYQRYRSAVEITADRSSQRIGDHQAGNTFARPIQYPGMMPGKRVGCSPALPGNRRRISMPKCWGHDHAVQQHEVLSVAFPTNPFSRWVLMCHLSDTSATTTR